MIRNVLRNMFLFSLAGVVGCSQDPQYTEQDLEASEQFIDAFYSFSADRLRDVLQYAEPSLASILYYQGWAEGGSYSIVKRHGCEVSGGEITCPVTVKDDLMVALKIDFDVTDTFHLTVEDGRIRSVVTSSNDLDVFRDAEKWVWKERPELVSTPCAGYWGDGKTPGDCVRAMVSGYREYTETVEYGDHLSRLELPE